MRRHPRKRDRHGLTYGSCCVGVGQGPKAQSFVVLTDLRAAFYRVVWELVFGGLVRHEEWDDMIDSIDIPLILQPIMDKHTNEPGVLEINVKNPHVIPVSRTYTKTPGSRSAGMTKSPGPSWEPALEATWGT
eukprot:9427806-Pyramimonas_sp.AAC.1